MGWSAALEISTLQLILCSYLSVTFSVPTIVPGLSVDAFGVLFIEPGLDRDLPAICSPVCEIPPRLSCTAEQGCTLLTVGSASWHQFERELDRLQRELDDIRRESQPRFADSSAKRYRVGSRALRLLRGRR